MTTELHPLGFFLPENTRLLMLGSFPPPKARWSMDFYYPNIQNDMWRILGLIFYGNKDAFLRDKKAFSEEKAMDTLLSVLPGTEEPKVGFSSEFSCMGRTMRLFRMPSSSRAYPRPLEEKAAIYRGMFETLGMV